MLKNTEMATECIKRFGCHETNEDQRIRMESIRAKAMLLAMEICGSCPESRERSVAVTKIEEAVFWANASIARNEQEDDAR